MWPASQNTLPVGRGWPRLAEAGGCPEIEIWRWRGRAGGAQAQGSLAGACVLEGRSGRSLRAAVAHTGWAPRKTASIRRDECSPFPAGVSAKRERSCSSW